MAGPARARGGAGVFAAATLCATGGLPHAHAQDAASLQARHAELREALAASPFGRPLHLESRELAGRVEGEIHAEVDTPHAVAGPALRRPDHWCDILILHLNVKGCRGSAGPTGSRLSVHMGRKFDQPLADAYRVDFGFEAKPAQPGYQQVVLEAEQGPLGTSRYRIVLESVALDARHSFIHLSYSYASGLPARLALQVYLATIGRDKVGFSIIGHDRQGKPIPIGGARGVIERNAMRYYLAIESFLGALGAPAKDRVEKRLNDWFTGAERYPVQLHEMERGPYLEMKRGEIRRQQAPRVPDAP